MLNDRLRPVLTMVARSLLIPGLVGLGVMARAGQAGQVQPGPVLDQARSGAQAASASATKSSSPVPVARQKQPAEPKVGRKAPTQAKEETPPIPTPGKMPVIIGLRDPFKLPPPPGPAMETSGEEIKGPLPPGARGLVINQVRLEGIVRLDQSNTMIAVVTNYTNRAYFLHENDPVFNGVVSKITPDSIIFRENYLDQFGRAQVREVVRRLSGALGEGR